MSVPIEESIITYRASVYPAQCDAMGHMTVQYYVAAFDQAMWHMVAELGYDPEWRLTKNRGWADVNYNINFKNELKSGDLFLVRSSLKKVGNSSITTCHQMFDLKNKIIADIEMISIYFDLLERKAEAIPDSIRVECQRLLST